MNFIYSISFEMLQYCIVMLMVTDILEEPAVSTFKAQVSPIQLKSTMHIAKAITHIITVYVIQIFVYLPPMCQLSFKPTTEKTEIQKMCHYFLFHSNGN
jgi:hypothetical protein